MNARFDNLMMSYPLTLTHFFERSRRLFARKTIATRVPGRPSWGSWLTYGLGTENQNLPAYVVLDDPLGLPGPRCGQRSDHPSRIIETSLP